MLSRPAPSAATALTPRPLAIALFTCLASCVGDCDLFCFPDDVGEPLTLVASVRDAHGNRVPVDSASLQQGANTVDCTIDASDPSAGCSDTVEGAGMLSVQAAGQTITREVNIGVVEQNSCAYTQEVELRLPGPGCAKPQGNAIEGRLLEAQGKEIMGGTATAQLYGRRQTCRMTGARFECPSMSSYSAMYTLELRFGLSRMEREVFVFAHDCQVGVTDATLNLAETCGTSPVKSPAVIAIVAGADAATTEVRIVADGGSGPAACARASTEPALELKFNCPALTATGGGTYRVTVDAAPSAQTKIFEIGDDGCNAYTAVGFFYF